jgi:hypothetical protein
MAPISLTVEPNSLAIAEGPKATERHQQQENIWNLVWRKRAIYFLTVIATAHLLLYPLYRDSYAFEELRTRLRLLSDTIRLIGNVLPGLAGRWVDAYTRDPASFVISASLVFFFLAISAKKRGRSMIVCGACGMRLCQAVTRPPWTTRHRFGARSTESSSSQSSRLSRSIPGSRISPF